MRVPVVGVLVVLALGIGAYVLVSRDLAKSRSETGAEKGKSASVTVDSPLKLETATESDLKRASASRCVVLDEEGRPVVGARAHFFTASGTAAAATVNWPRVDWEGIGATIGLATTNGEGQLSAPLRASEPWLGCWIVHERHEASWISMEAAAASVLPQRIVLKSTNAWSARVVDLAGRVVPGARVVQIFDLRPPGRLGRFGPVGDSSDPRRWLRLVTEADATGRAVLTPLAGPSWITCESGTLRSPPWFGRQPADVELVLGAFFALDGRVTSEVVGLDTSGMSVRWMARSGSSTDWIDTLDVRRDGTIGPIQLPLVPVDKYVFQLVGEGLALDVCEAFVPTAGGSLTIELNAAMGQRMQVSVVDEAARPVEGALVIVSWIKDGLWRATERLTDSRGIAPFAEIARTIGFVQVRKSGFVPSTSPELDLHTAEGSSYTVELQPGGTIRGRVTHAGKGVRDFTLYFWQGQHENLTRHPVANAEDGRFELDQAALGDNSLLATSEDHPTSEAVSVLVARDAPVEVEIQLPDHVVGSGKIVDAGTSLPISGAVAQAWISHGRQMMRLWGSPVAADSHGSFEMQGLRSGTNLIQFTAPGYSTRVLHLQVPPKAQRHDLGVIGILPKSTLIVQLEGPPGLEFHGYQAALLGGLFVPDKPIPATGRIEFTDLDPCGVTLAITKPNGDELGQFVRLEGGSTLVVKVPIRGRSLAVQVEKDAAVPLPAGSTLEVAHLTAQGRRTNQWFGVPEDGRIDIPWIDDGLAVLELVDSENAIVAVKEVQLTNTGPELVTIRPEERERTIRVVDRAKKPLQGVQLFVTHPEVHVGWTLTLVTDAAGECVLRGIGMPRVRAYLYSPSLGMSPSITLDLPEGEKLPIELVLDPEHDLRVQVLDGTKAVPWINLAAFDVTETGLGLAEQNTDETGFAKWPRVSTGRYLVEVRHPGFWPTRTEFEVGTTAKVHTIQARRIGDLRVVARSKLGNPRANVAFALRSIDLDQDVNTWIEHGRISVEGGVLATNAAGESIVRGLAAGAYAWSSTDEDGVAKAGTARVEAGRIGELVIE